MHKLVWHQRAAEEPFCLLSMQQTCSMLIEAGRSAAHLLCTLGPNGIICYIMRCLVKQFSSAGYVQFSCMLLQMADET